MSDKSGSNVPRENVGRVFSLFLLGLILFIGLSFMILPSTGLIEEPSFMGFSAVLSGNDSDNSEVAGSSIVEIEDPDKSEKTLINEVDEKKYEREYASSEFFEVLIEQEQNETTITLSEIEMKGDLLIATFTILNGSENTLYFPFYGTNVSFDDNGGSMFRELYSEGDAGYDQFPTIINPQAKVEGKIAYSPLLYEDKPFTIYIRNITYRELELDWKPFSFYVDLNGSGEVEVTYSN